jgi:hypothetical protein
VKTTLGQYPNLNTHSSQRGRAALVDPKDPKKLLEGEGKPALKSSPDYKLELSSPSASAPPVSTPSAPDLPTPKAESAPKIDLKEKANDLIKDEATEKAKETKIVEEKAGTLKKPAIIFIKGWDVFSSPFKSETGYAGVGKIAESIKGSRLYGWNQKDEILKEIEKREKSQPIILVGHSFGGDTAVEIADALDSLEHNFRPVDLLVTIDAVGFNNDIIPQNVKKHLNVFGENSFLLNDGPHVARRHEKTEVINILSPLDHTELDDDKGIQYEVVGLINESLGKIS